jgi:hypothetical protein
MTKILPGILILFPFFAITSSFAQDTGFPYGDVTPDQLRISSYPADTTANAVVLNEFGETYQENGGDYNLIHLYHNITKIFNAKGYGAATIAIFLRKSKNGTDKVYDIQASTFNLSSGQIRETKLDPAAIFTQPLNKDFDVVKFTLPDLRPGSVIEYMYTFESPNFDQFKQWDFQSDIPKVHSEYWTKIPAIYTYNIILRGFLKLDKDTGSKLDGCLRTSEGSCDCSFNQFAMDHIPAFREEEFMTAPGNFKSVMHFELSQVQRFDGTRSVFSKEWKDVDRFMQYDSDFGMRKPLLKGQDLLAPAVRTAEAGVTDLMTKAKKIFMFVRDQFHWNGEDGIIGTNGMKKTVETSSGNTADINLALIAALRAGGLKADPVLLATRDREVPNHLSPVILEFNYIIARLQIADTVLFLDATDPLLGFGVIGLKCMNGQGRWMKGDDPSEWVDIPPTTLNREVDLFTLQIGENGSLKGTLDRMLDGYKGYDERKKIQGFKSEDDYIDALSGEIGKWKITGYYIDSLKNPDAPLEESLEVQQDGSVHQAGTLFFNPFILDHLQQNPFLDPDRSYPVDFGIGPENRSVLVIHYPEDFSIQSVPQQVRIVISNHGGVYQMGCDSMNHTLVVSYELKLTKGVYPAGDYSALRELYSRVMQQEQASVILVKR